MSNRTAAPLSRAVAAAVLLAPLAGLPGGGCKGEPAAAPATAAAAGTARASVAGVAFEHPAGWTVTPLPDGSGVNVTGPADAGWEPNVFVEVQPNPDDRAVDELLSSNVALLGARKQDFGVRNQSVLDHPNGFKYGRVEYTNTSEAVGEKSAGVPLTQWSIVAPLPGKKQRLQVQAAAATAAWDKYRPQFEKLVDSIALPK
jgi:hypothetical protein